MAYKMNNTGHWMALMNSRLTDGGILKREG